MTEMIIFFSLRGILTHQTNLYWLKKISLHEIFQYALHTIFKAKWK